MILNESKNMLSFILTHLAQMGESRFNGFNKVLEDGLIINKLDACAYIYVTLQITLLVIYNRNCVKIEDLKTNSDNQPRMYV